MSLKLHEYNTMAFDGGCLASLPKAYNVELTVDIQQPHILSFEYPMDDDKSVEITENRIVSHEGQAYRLTDVTRVYDKDNRIVKAKAEMVFSADGKCRHFPTIGNDKDGTDTTIGVDPYKVLRIAVGMAGMPFTLFTDAELSARGLRRIGSDGTKIDFMPTDKINCYDVVQEVIKCYGRGELYVENYKFAVVEKIGEDNGVRLSLSKNLSNLSVQRQMENLTTRLYPYGADDLTISSVNGGKVYIDSPNIGKYGVIEGYKDYSEITSADKLKDNAMYDLMDEDNDDRLDTPQITITGDMIDLARLTEYGDFYKGRMGDYVRVVEGDTVYKKRIIRMTTYPYSNRQPSVTIGSPTLSNPFFAAWQKSELFKTIRKNSGQAYKLKAQNLTGTVKSDGVRYLNENDVAVDTQRLTAAESTISALQDRVMALEQNSATKQDISELQEQIDAIRG